MSLSTFLKLVNKAFKFAVMRPIQRFNIYNRARNYLGPDAKYFRPAPRAIGSSMVQTEALVSSPKSFSATEEDDILIKQTSNKIEVKKLLVSPPAIGGDNKVGPLRPLPKLTKLDRRDPADIWNVDKTPPGRLSLHMLQELMLNKLGDDKHWTPKMLAERYKIREEYAESLVKYLKQVRIVVSPRTAMFLDYVGRENPTYQAAKHIVYHVDKSLRNDVDKMYDKMYLPTDQIDKEIREMVTQDDGLVPTQQFDEIAKVRRLVKRPAPLRLSPVNAPEQKPSQRIKSNEAKRLASKKHPSNADDVT